jgi:hypothetical protein
MLVSFAKMNQMNVMFALFVLLVAIVCLHPEMVKKLNQTVLGRLIIVAIIVYFSVHNTTVGILAALVIICVMQSYIYREGFEGGATDASASAPTVSASSLEIASQINQPKVDELKKKIEEAKMNTPDQLATQEQMKPVASTASTPPMGGNGDDVAPSVKETFQTLGYSAY